MIPTRCPVNFTWWTYDMCLSFLRTWIAASYCFNNKRFCQCNNPEILCTCEYIHVIISILKSLPSYYTPHVFSFSVNTVWCKVWYNMYFSMVAIWLSNHESWLDPIKWLLDVLQVPVRKMSDITTTHSACPCLHIFKRSGNL